MTTPTPEPRGPLLARTPTERAAIGKRLRQLRLEQDIFQSELAHAMGFSTQSGLSKVERGTKGLTKPKLIRAARYLGVRPETITDVTE
jgi:transcriptional regulator with XRE-family HTH domain